MLAFVHSALDFWTAFFSFMEKQTKLTDVVVDIFNNCWQNQEVNVGFS